MGAIIVETKMAVLNDMGFSFLLFCDGTQFVFKILVWQSFGVAKDWYMESWESEIGV